MIKLDISTALFLFLFGTVILVLFFWAFTEKRSKFGGFGSLRKDVWHCSICKYMYINPEPGDFSRCPQCNSINKRRDKQ